MRVTQKILQQMIDDLNVSAGFDANHPIVNRDTDLKGRYFLNMAYGGYKLSQYLKGTACKDISSDGYGTARQLYNYLLNFIHLEKVGLVC